MTLSNRGSFAGSEKGRNMREDYSSTQGGKEKKKEGFLFD